MKNLYNLTYPQKSILLTEHFYKDTSINNICGTAIINADLDFNVLKKAINAVVRDNESFRIRLIKSQDEIKQYVSEFKEFDVEIIDIKNKSEIENIEKSLANKVYPLYNDVNLFDFKIFRLEDNTGGYVVDVHHLISDGWTLGLIGRKIIKAYSMIKNNIIEDSAIEESYLDYAQNQESYMNSSKFMKDKKYWNDLFETIPTSTVLPSDKQTQNSELSCLGERLTFSISKAKMKLIEAFCAQNQRVTGARRFCQRRLLLGIFYQKVRL